MPLSLHGLADGVDFPVVVDRLPHIVWIAGNKGEMEYLNQRGAEYVGSAAVAQLSSNWTSVIHPDDVEAMRRESRRAGRARQPVSAECRLLRYDGAYRWHAVRADPLDDRQEPGVRWVGTATDIHDAKMLQSELHAAQRSAAETVALLETLLANAPVGFGFVDRDYRRVLVNAVLAAFNGSTVEEQLGRRLPDLTPLVWPQMEPHYRVVLDTGQTVLDVEVVGPSAADPLKDRHWSVSYYPVTLNSETIGVGVIATDVTQRHEAERARSLMSAIVEGSGDAIFATTPELVVTSWNGAAERLLGYTAAEIIGQTTTSLAPGARNLDGVPGRLLAGGPTERHDTKLRRKDGHLIDVRITVSPVAGHRSTTAGLSVVVEDIAERVRITRAQRAAEIRTEAGFEQVASAPQCWI